jgi:hypothetical protein
MAVYGFVTPALMAHVRFSLRSVISRAWREVRRCLASAWLKFPASVRFDSRGQNSFPIRPDCASEPRKRLFTCNNEDADPSHGIVRSRGTFGIAQETNSNCYIECTHVPQKPLSQRSRSV